jgi:ADP-L-glycero-D-manno-heptose 6-epimerase
MRRIAGQAPADLSKLVQQGLIEYIPFPDALRGKYQCFTQADQTQLRAAGYAAPFLNVEQGVGRYIDWLSTNADFLGQPSA